MSETEAEKRERILHSERRHDVPPPPVGLAEGVTIAALGADPIDAKFHTLTAHPSKWFAPRGTVPTSVVIHCTAATNPASSTAAFFHSSVDSGSTQGIGDDIQGFTMVPDDAVCAGAPPLNQEGLHIEQPGLVEWTRQTWLSHDDDLRRVAYHTAQWCKSYSIPVVLLHSADLKRLGERAKGITYHAAITDAFHESTHTDPGPNFPWDVFMGYVHFYFDGGDDMPLTDKQAAALDWLADNTAGLKTAVEVAEGFTTAADPKATTAGKGASPSKQAGFRAGRELKVQEAGGHGSSGG